jgi:hypothetical protein
MKIFLIQRKSQISIYITKVCIVIFYNTFAYIFSCKKFACQAIMLLFNNNKALQIVELTWHASILFTNSKFFHV